MQTKHTLSTWEAVTIVVAIMVLGVVIGAASSTLVTILAILVGAGLVWYAATHAPRKPGGWRQQ